MDKIGFIKTFLQLSDQDLLSSLFSFLEGINFEQAEEENTEKSLAELIGELSSLISSLEMIKITYNSTSGK